MQLDLHSADLHSADLHSADLHSRQPDRADLPGPGRASAGGRPRGFVAVGSAALALTVLFGAAACGSGAGSASNSSGGSAQSGAANADPAGAPKPQAAAGGSAAGPIDAAASAGSATSVTGRADDSPPATPAADLLQQRRLILDTAVSLTVANVLQSAARVRTLAAAAGGYVGDEETDGGPGQTARSTLTLRVPAAKAGSVTDQVAALGTVRSRSATSQDVTQQSIDVASRLASQKASVARIRALLARATKISDIVLIEGELSSRESTLESLEAQLKGLDDAVDLATVTVSLSPHGAPATKPATTHTGFLGGLDRGWTAFTGALVVALTVLGAVLPFAALLALIGVPALLLWRRRRPALPPATTPIPEP